MLILSGVTKQDVARCHKTRCPLVSHHGAAVRAVLGGPLLRVGTPLNESSVHAHHSAQHNTGARGHGTRERSRTSSHISNLQTKIFTGTVNITIVVCGEKARLLNMYTVVISAVND